MKKNPHPLDGARNAALDLIEKCADRAVHVYAGYDVRVDRQTIIMDLTACHFSGCKLRLDDLLAADDFNFMHDIGGINQNLNRDTYAMNNCFSPRFRVRIDPVRIPT